MKLFIRKLYITTLYILWLFIVVFLCVEIILHIWNPIPLRLKGDQIILQTNTHQTIQNPYNTDKIDKTIKVNRNSIGFRGPDPPINYSSALSILTIGGSTTAGEYLSEGKTWSDDLFKKLRENYSNVWLNNAGMDGQSTFGHLHLLSQYIFQLQPKVLVFLIGINDYATDRQRSYDDKNYILKSTTILYSNALMFLARYSNLAAILQYYLGSKIVYEQGLFHHYVFDFTKMATKNESDNDIADAKTMFNSKYISQYKERVKKLIDLTHSMGAIPIFLTQPVLYGVGTDDVTGLDLEKVIAEDYSDTVNSGKLKWEVLSLYNQATKDVASANNAYVIDLADKMPKSSKYYYDFIHYSNAGAQKVADLIYPEFCDILLKSYPSYQTKDCPVN